MEFVAKLVKGTGQRFTAQKKDVYQALKQTPQTVLEILNSVTVRKKTINKVTIYRILSSFVRLGIIRKIHLGREVRFELTNSGHHHHLVCMDCGGIEDIELEEESIFTEVHRQSSFKVISHSLELFGTCKKCQ